MKKTRPRRDAVATAPLDWLATWAGYFGYSPLEKRRRPNPLTRGHRGKPAIGFQLLEPRFALTASPILLKDINPGAGDSSPAALAAIGSTVYFIASDGTQGSELWKTDGTAVGTVLVKDIYPGALGSSPGNLTAVGSALYFTANNGTSGSELWKSDGTAAGTVLVKDINPGIADAAPGNLTVLGSTLYFTANNGTSGSELWKSDGTATGTVLLKDINVGADSSKPRHLTAAGSTLYFIADEAGSGGELWKTDGTTNGTSLLKAFGQYSSFNEYHQAVLNDKIDDLTAVGSTLYFTADNGISGSELWKTGGTPAGTVLVKDINPGTNNSIAGNLTAVGSTLYLTASDGISGVELWKSDGTAAGTLLVKDINPGASDASPSHLTAVGSTLFFTAKDGTAGGELWKSDGTSAGTTLVRTFGTSWVYSGGVYNYLVEQMNIGTLAAAGSSLFFTATDSTSGWELWSSDGSAAGTALVKDINPGTADSSPQNLTAAGQALFFTATNGTSGRELWSLSTATQPAPVVTIDTSVKRLAPGDATTCTFTLSAPSTTFTASDVYSVNGTVSRFTAISSTVYTCTFTAKADFTGTGYVVVYDNTFTDAAGNGNKSPTGSVVASVAIDTTTTTAQPTITIQSNKASLKAGETAVISYTLSEPSGTFTASDLYAVGGTLSGFRFVSGTTFAADFTPTPNSTGTGYAIVYDNAFTDAAGNGNGSATGAVIATLVIDAVRPTITIQSNKASLKAGETAVISYTLSEPSGTFTVSDLYAVGGTLSGFRFVSGTTFAADFTPTPNSTGTGYAVVYDNAFTDAAGNGNGSATGAVMTSLAIDAVRPTIAIQSNKAALKAGETAVISYTLSKPSGTFTASDLYAVGGALSGFRFVSGTTFAADFTPTPNSTGTGYAIVYDNAFTDAAGNGNTSSTGAVMTSLAIDAVRPTIAIQSNKASLKAGETAVISYTLSEPSGTFTASDLYAVGGTLSRFRYVSGTTFAADFTPTPDTTGTGYAIVYDNAFTDAAGNGNTSSTGAVMTSLAIDAVRPTIAIQSNKASLKAGETAVISYTLSEPSGTFTASDLYAVGGTLSRFRYVSGTTFAADFTPTPDTTGTGYAIVYDNAFTDAAGNGNISASGAVMTALVIDAKAPTATLSLSKTSVKAGDTATVTVQLSEPTATFTLSDLKATGGTLSTLAYIGNNAFTAIFTPAANTTTTGSISLYDDAFTDAAGNGNRGPGGVVTVPITIDTVAPTATIQASTSLLKAGDTATVTVTLSEPSTTLTAADLYAVGGTLAAFTAVSSTVYTATFTPTDKSMNTGYVVVYDGAFTDLAGNPNKSSGGYIGATMQVDTILPTVKLSADKKTLRQGEAVPITITLSEPSTTFTADDITLAWGGTLSGFTFSGGTTYRATLTPNPDIHVEYVTVADNSFTDAAGNGNQGSEELRFEIDSVPPSVSITGFERPLKPGESTTLEFRLSEASETFTASDIYPTGGTVSNFQAELSLSSDGNGNPIYVNGYRFTATFTATAATETVGYVAVYDNTFTDAAGNGNKSDAGAVIYYVSITSGTRSFDPSGDEQEVLEHINRMRMNPQGELAVLFTSLNPLVARDPDANNAVRQYNISSATLQSQWAALTPAQPLAWNESLYKTALAHDQAMIKADAQEHVLPGELSLGDRISAAGYAFSSVGENIYAFAKNPFYAHSGLAIDWGNATPGHRTNMMKASFREVGVGIVPEYNSGTKVGPLVMTQDFGYRTDQTNSVLVGAIYADRNSNGRYDSGEGLGGVNVQIVGTGGTFTTSTMTAGGYQMALPAGTYTVRAVGGGVLTPSYQANVVVGSSNVKVDFKV